MKQELSYDTEPKKHVDLATDQNPLAFYRYLVGKSINVN